MISQLGQWNCLWLNIHHETSTSTWISLAQMTMHANCQIQSVPTNYNDCIGMAGSHKLCHQSSPETRPFSTVTKWVLGVCSVQSGQEPWSHCTRWIKYCIPSYPIMGRNLCGARHRYERSKRNFASQDQEELPNVLTAICSCHHQWHIRSIPYNPPFSDTLVY